MRRYIFDERFAEAFLHLASHRVMGRRLRPFSMWHKLQLEYANSPLLTGGDVGVADLVFAAEVCCTRFPRIAVNRIPRRGLRRILWMLWAERVDLRRERDAFEAYSEDYCSLPKIEAAKKGEKTQDMDDCLSDVGLYRKMTGCPRGEAWDIPLGELYWMNAMFSRSEGADFSIVTPIEEARKARLAAIRDAKIAEIRDRMIAEGMDPAEAPAAALAAYRKSLDAAREASRRARPKRPKRRR